ncbi:MAG: class 3 adenylate cyclase [Ilumatobacter sp.]|jgi:class 3 adenylate cyclase
MGVPLSARIAGLALANQTVGSRTVNDLVVDSGCVFKDFGEHILKGLDAPLQGHEQFPATATT